MAGRIVAMGGLSEPLLHFALSLTGKDRPRVALLPTAGGEDDRGVVCMYELLGAHADVDVVRLFGIPDSPLERIAAADAVLVPGGNTANMLAVWRVHGIDDALGAIRPIGDGDAILVKGSRVAGLERVASALLGGAGSTV